MRFYATFDVSMLRNFTTIVLVKVLLKCILPSIRNVKIHTERQVYCKNTLVYRVYHCCACLYFSLLGLVYYFK